MKLLQNVNDNNLLLISFALMSVKLKTTKVNLRFFKSQNFELALRTNIETKTKLIQNNEKSDKHSPTKYTAIRCDAHYNKVPNI